MYGNVYHHADNVTEGQFAFQAMEEGHYLSCFFAADHNPSATVTIDFDWKSAFDAKDWTNVAKKGSIEVSTRLLLNYCISLVFLVLLYYRVSCYSKEGIAILGTYVPLGTKNT